VIFRDQEHGFRSLEFASEEFEERANSAGRDDEAAIVEVDVRMRKREPEPCEGSEVIGLSSSDSNSHTNDELNPSHYHSWHRVRSCKSLRSGEPDCAQV
jgi:hypothetical protein